MQLSKFYVHLHTLVPERKSDSQLLPSSHSVGLLLKSSLVQRPYIQTGLYLQTKQADPSFCC